MKTCKCGETFDDLKAVSFASREGRAYFACPKCGQLYRYDRGPIQVTAVKSGEYPEIRTEKVVGQVVTIKSIEWYLNHKNRGGNVNFPSHILTFVEDMMPYCGKMGVITLINCDGYYRLNIDGGRFWWTEDMLEPS